MSGNRSHRFYRAAYVGGTGRSGPQSAGAWQTGRSLLHRRFAGCRDSYCGSVPGFGSGVCQKRCTVLLWRRGGRKIYRIRFCCRGKGGMDIEFVLHFAACATIQKAQENGREAWRTNYDGTRNVLAAALRRWQRHDSSFRGFFTLLRTRFTAKAAAVRTMKAMNCVRCHVRMTPLRRAPMNWCAPLPGRAVFRRSYTAFAMFTARAIITRAGLFRGRCIACCIPKPLPC